jgi:Universal stress protein family
MVSGGVPVAAPSRRLVGRLPGLGRRRGDPVRSDHADVVLVPLDGPPTKAALRRAADEADGGTVAVVGLLKVHGSSWGFPNPGLMPTATEKAEQRARVDTAITALERLGVDADGQITATRNPAKVIAGSAQRRGARLVLIEQAPVGKVRGALEGDVAKAVRRRLDGVEVELLARPGTAVRR